MDKSCPLCRKPLPPGPDKLFDLGYGMYMKVKGEIDRGRPGVDEREPWPRLTAVQQREMDEAVAMLREAADQGHMLAQANCGDMYIFGFGVATDDRLGFVYTEKAARQGLATAEVNTGVLYRDGRGCEQSYERAAEWFEKAVRRGDAAAMTSLGGQYYNGLGVPRSFERAAELWKQAAAQGQPVRQRDQANFLTQMLQVLCQK